MPLKTSYLIQCLREIPPSGKSGVEGIVGELLSAWTGRSFILCRSGSQQGRDASTAGEDDVWMLAEVKRYTDPSDLGARDLCGGLAEAVRETPDLDLWALVATTSVPEQIRRALYHDAQRDRVDLLIIDTEGAVSRLDVFFAAHLDLSVDAVAVRSATVDRARLRRDLRRIRSQSRYESVEAELRRILTELCAGLSSVRAEAKEWLERTVADEDRAQAELAQRADIRNPRRRRPISRPRVQEQLDRWWTSSENSVCFVTGDEGFGKTWAVLDWTTGRVEREPDFPAPLVLTSNAYPLQPPERWDGLVVTAVQRIDRRMTDLRRIEARLRKWLRRDGSSGTRLLLVLDGLNERPSYPWQRLLESFRSSELGARARLLCTSRGAFFDRLFAPSWRECIVEVPIYDDDELRRVIAETNIDLARVPADILPLMARPRLCNVVVELYDAMVESGEFTLHRLFRALWLLWSWMERYSSSTNLNEERLRRH